MEERQYQTLEERLAQKKAERKMAKKRAKLEKKGYEIKEEIPETEKMPRGKKMVIFLVVLITLFCLSFTTTAFIIINANRLTYDTGNDSELKKQIEELQQELQQKNEEIERLSVNSSAPSFSAPVINTIIQESKPQKKEEKPKKETSSKTDTPVKEETPLKEEPSKIEEPAPEEDNDITVENDDIISELEGILN